MQRVLVTDGEQRSSLAVVRSLGRAGYHVEVCSALRAPLAAASKFSSASHTVTDPTEDAPGFVADLEAIIDRGAIDILLPMTDATASVALGLRSQLPGLLIPFPPAESWSQVSDKKRLMEVAEGLGVPTPRQEVVEDVERDLDAAAAFAEVVGYPVIIKPHRSALATPDRVLRFGVQIVRDRPALEAALRALPAEGFPVLVQERIQGAGLGGFFLARDGRVIQSFAHRRIREKPPTGGVSVVRESTSVRDDVRRHSEALLDHFGWSGIAMVEFKEDAATGAVYLMEINGRFWGSLQLAIDAGVDFPRTLLDVFLNPNDTQSRPPSVAKTGIRTRWFWGDVDHLLWILRAPRGYAHETPQLPGRASALARFLLPWRPGLRYEVFQWSDPRPFLRESRQWLSQVLGSRSR